MCLRLKRKNIAKTCELVSAYAELHCVPEKPEPAPSQDGESEIACMNFSTRPPKEVTDLLHEVKYSREQDEEALKTLMERLASAPVRQRQKTFVEKLMELIDEKGLTDPKVYKKAQIDRRLFSKMMSDVKYQPAKDTCLAIALAMQLTPDETADLLSRAGYALSRSLRRDVMIEYFIREGISDLHTVNEVLTRLGEKKLGR